MLLLYIIHLIIDPLHQTISTYVTSLISTLKVYNLNNIAIGNLIWWEFIDPLHQTISTYVTSLISTLNVYNLNNIAIGNLIWWVFIDTLWVKTDKQCLNIGLNNQCSINLLTYIIMSTIMCMIQIK